MRKIRENKRYKNILKNKNIIKKYKKHLDDYKIILDDFNDSIETLQEVYSIKKSKLNRLMKSDKKRFKRLERKLSNVYMICDYCYESKPFIDFIYYDVALGYINEHCIECYLEEKQEYTGFPYLSDYKKYKMLESKYEK
ncbi:hypothetical protein [Brachyspira catarrhinii]|uniref:Uncharacterized protein n=1 Tax=Brachyspira catarrhinii TaxID=2528966 RepID=A0ABY2TQ94_9SPIR|nr:hypothetical protein [Brachyspira catarrhinii]TKZ34804.1 hypothetical protein EZH24_07595 [Brachyspira catarrhinii]